MPAAQEVVHQQGGEDLQQPTSQNHVHNEKYEHQVEEIEGYCEEQQQVQEFNNNNNNHLNINGNGGGDVFIDDDKTLVNEEENGSRMSSDEENYNDKKEGFVLVKLSDIRKEVQCPICLGIIRKTRTVMECLHRFCRECIDKSMRLGNNECPACRTHCASRRSLRDDPNYDALIAAIYPNIDQFEEEELAFEEDVRARNQEIQAAIAQTFRRQTEALSKKRKSSLSTYRRRRNYRSQEEEDANGHDGGKETSSADERCTEAKTKRPKRWRGQPSPAGASRDGSRDGGGNEKDKEVQRDTVVSPAGLVGSSEMLAWGKGGIRSNTRHGNGSAGHAKHSRNRIARLNEHLRNLQENDSELDIQVVLFSLDQQKPSALQHSFLSSRPSLSVAQLCQFIALQTTLPPERVEILAAKGLSSCPSMQDQSSSSNLFEACKDNLQVLDSEETLAGLRDACNFARGRLMLAYRQKLPK